MAIIPVVVGFSRIPVGGTWVAPVTGFSAEASQFLNRIADPGATRKNLYAAMIDGLVSDGVWSLLDALYILAADVSGNALTNLKSSSFSLTVNGTMTFTANTGYQSNGVATSNLDTGFTPSTAGGVYTQNSASFGGYSLTNSTTGLSATPLGSLDSGGTHRALFLPQNGSSNALVAVNTGGTGAAANTQHQGMWVATRTASNLQNLYKNGSALIADTVNTSTGLPNRSILIFARNNTTADFPYPDQMSAAFIGGGLNVAQSLQLSNRINTYMTALSINVY